jgi:hypothetical protein
VIPRREANTSAGAGSPDLLEASAGLSAIGFDSSPQGPHWCGFAVSMSVLPFQGRGAFRGILSDSSRGAPSRLKRWFAKRKIPASQGVGNFAFCACPYRLRLRESSRGASLNLSSLFSIKCGKFPQHWRKNSATMGEIFRNPMGNFPQPFFRKSPNSPRIL